MKTAVVLVVLALVGIVVADVTVAQFKVRGSRPSLASALVVCAHASVVISCLVHLPSRFRHQGELLDRPVELWCVSRSYFGA